MNGLHGSLNRTFVELKHQYCKDYIESNNGLNRTFVELKL